MKFFARKNRAVKRWHSRAMVIDVSKTRVTFIKSEKLIDIEESGNDPEQIADDVVSQPRNTDKSEYQPLF
jgi:hypothetical protein